MPKGSDSSPLGVLVHRSEMDSSFLAMLFSNKHARYVYVVFQMQDMLL